MNKSAYLELLRKQTQLTTANFKAMHNPNIRFALFKRSTTDEFGFIFDRIFVTADSDKNEVQEFFNKNNLDSDDYEIVEQERQGWEWVDIY